MQFYHYARVQGRKLLRKCNIMKGSPSRVPDPSRMNPPTRQVGDALPTSSVGIPRTNGKASFALQNYKPAAMSHVIWTKIHRTNLQKLGIRPTTNGKIK
jgi:hypothetical protein